MYDGETAVRVHKARLLQQLRLDAPTNLHNAVHEDAFHIFPIALYEEQSRQMNTHIHTYK